MITLGDLLALVSEDTEIRVTDMDGSVIASYDGRNSIDLSLNTHKAVSVCVSQNVLYISVSD